MPFDDDIAAIARRQHALVSRTQVRELGGTRQMMRTRIAAGRWRELLPGVFVVNGAPVTWRTKVMAATLATGGVASHRTAPRSWRSQGSVPVRSSWWSRAAAACATSTA